MKRNPTPEEALEKLNHTICLNTNNQTLTYGIDTYGDGPDGTSCDCSSVEEFIQCYNALLSNVEVSDMFKKFLQGRIEFAPDGIVVTFEGKDPFKTFVPMTSTQLKMFKEWYNN